MFKIANPEKGEPKLRHRLKIIFSDCILLNWDLSSFIMHFIISGINLLTDIKWLNVFHIITIILMREKVRSILQAIWISIGQIIATLILMVVIIFVFTLIHMSFLDLDYWKSDTISCTKVYECFSEVLNLGSRYPVGIGDHLIITNIDNDKMYWYKFVYELAFHVIINKILITVIFGIIVANFGQLRT